MQEPAKVRGAAIALAVLALSSLVPVARAQAPAASTPQDQLKLQVAAAKQAAAENQVALRQYTWVERTTMSLKGETKKVELAQVTHDADGKIQKTPLSDAAEAKKKPGLRGKVVENKTEELKDYMAQVKALIGEYVPPAPVRMQEAFAAGRVALSTPGQGVVQLKFTDYVRPGDQMTMQFATATKKIRHLDVSSALENKDPVKLSVDFQFLPDSTGYAGVAVLDAVAKQVLVKVEQIQHQKIAR
jgi:hypothetical protein